MKMLDLINGGKDTASPVSTAVAASNADERDQPIMVAQGNEEPEKKEEEREVEPQLFTRGEVKMLQNL